MDTDKFNLADRLRRSKGRPGRTVVASTRLTEDELGELEAAAAEHGKALSEWARDALLRAARLGPDDPVFTEVIATRILLNEMLRHLAVSTGMPSEEYMRVLEDVRRKKRGIAREVMQQYVPPREQS